MCRSVPALQGQFVPRASLTVSEILPSGISQPIVQPSVRVQHNASGDTGHRAGATELRNFHSTPPARPTDGVDVYFENPSEEDEHADFIRAKMELEERRMNRINEVMREWAAADHRAKNAPNTDRMALNKHFQQILGTLEEQVASERQRLLETHLSRVLALLNDNRRMSLENYLTTLQAEPPQPNLVRKALIRYMQAEWRDRKHSVRHYRHIRFIDPQRAQQMKFQVFTHLRVIEERMNQSLALLYNVPELAKALSGDV
ncbi:amyloid beta precursor like protein 1-like, partial [Mustelus asterias]